MPRLRVQGSRALPQGDGEPFDDGDFTGTDTFPALSRTKSFPFTSFVPRGRARQGAGLAQHRHALPQPGNTTFTGEVSLYGDFFGLGDRFTKNPRVVRGMIDVFEG